MSKRTATVRETIEPTDETNRPPDGTIEPSGETVAPPETLEPVEFNEVTEVTNVTEGTEVVGETAERPDTAEPGEQVSGQTTDGIDLQAIAANHPGLDPADDPDIEIDYRNRHLERAMTDDERIEVGNEMAAALQRAELYEEEKRDVDSRLKANIDRAYEQATTLGRSLRKGVREGAVQVKIVKNWHNGSIEVIRTDTGETLESRAMTFDEWQRTMLSGEQTGEAVPAPEVQEPAPDPDQGLAGEIEAAELEPENPVEALAAVAGGQVGHA